MIRETLGAAVCLSTALVAWHHVGWPLILKAASKRGASNAPAPLADEDLPHVTIVMPAHQEADHIVRKLQNLAALDYPHDRLTVLVICDGCTDGTPRLASEALASGVCGNLRAEVRDHHPNRGKVAVLNEAIRDIAGGLVALTDVSAMLPTNALRLAAAHYADPAVGAVGGTYRLGAASAPGEAVYWRYQTAVKRGEARLGAPLGMHGAFWTFRREAWEAIPLDTINDDFIMPAEILRRGYKLRYDERIVVVEEDESDIATDARRRRRIAAGNAQQLVRLLWLLDPRLGGTALAFASGKGLRVIMPFLMLFAGLGALALASGSAFYAFLAASVVTALIGAALGGLLGDRAPKPLAILHYMAAGHASSAVGVCRYAMGLHRGAWRRAGMTEPAFSGHVPASVQAAKRCADILIASLALLGSLPFWPLIALAIRLESPGPIIYRQMRVGRIQGDRTELFMMCKFRSMRSDAETGTGAVWAKKVDPRVTRVGWFLRKTRLDEIPQLLNVLAGDMSIVGPRPERPGFYQKLEEQIPFFSDRTVGIRPGITGFAQVRQGYDTSIDDVRRKVAMDHAYGMRLRSLAEWVRFDAWVMFKTVVVMVTGRGQ